MVLCVIQCFQSFNNDAFGLSCFIKFILFLEKVYFQFIFSVSMTFLVAAITEAPCILSFHGVHMSSGSFFFFLQSQMERTNFVISTEVLAGVTTCSGTELVFCYRTQNDKNIKQLSIFFSY